MRSRRPIALVCPFVVVSCPGICLAEAAEDLARSLSELLHGIPCAGPAGSPPPTATRRHGWLQWFRR
jgi:hypothetical protein